MTNTKSTKRALISSVLALFLCFTMLLGTTFAWFTDSVTSAGNIIQSGNLDVTLEWANGNEALDKADWNDASKGTIFNSKLWEPGYTDAKHLKVSNVGTLALKYELSIAPNGAVSKLADVIDVYYIDGGAQVADRNALDENNKIGSLRDLINNGICAGSLEAKENQIVTLVLKMQETAGNEYQGLGIGTDFAVRLVATQMTAELDSFDDQYDANAPFSLWDGKVPTEMPETLVVDGATQTIHVKDAAAFAYLSTLSAKWAEFYTDGNGTDYTNYKNGAGADYYYSNRWSVSLEADIDLGNHEIAPVVLKFGESTGASAFDGNGHTIRNINTSTGLFVDKARATFTDLDLENVKATNGALIGSADHGISYVTVKNATISGVDYVGGLVGYIYSSINNCQVIDSSVVATGKEAGGLAGYVVTSNAEATVMYNIVKNVNVYAGNRAAGLVAQPNVNVKVTNNTVDTVSVGAEDLSKYACGAVVSNALAPENVYDNTVKNADVAEKAVVIAADTAELTAALSANADKVVVTSGNYTFPTSKLGAGDVIECAGDVVFEGNSKLNINGATVVGATFANPTGTAADQTINGTFKDCVFTGYNGLRSCYAGETVVFENCVFSGDLYGAHFDGGANDVVFKNCTFSGFNAMGAAITKLTLDGCTFVANGKSGYNGINLWGSTDLINCTFVFDGTAGYEWVDAVGSNITVTAEGCVISDGTTERALVATDIGDYGTGNTITVK